MYFWKLSFVEEKGTHCSHNEQSNDVVSINEESDDEITVIGDEEKEDENE